MFPFRISFTIFGAEVFFGPYALFFFLAILIALCGCYVMARRDGLPRKEVAGLIVVMLLSALIGARILFVLTNFSLFSGNIYKIFTFSSAYFSLFGGVIMTLLTGYLYCKKFRLIPMRVGDIFVPVLGLSIATMRIGCFLNGCCFGKVTSLPLGVTFPPLSPAHLYQLSTTGDYFFVHAVHPTELYELVAAVLMSGLAFYLLKRKSPTGVPMASFLIGFSLFRLFNDMLRVDPEGSLVSKMVYPWIYSSVILVGCVWVYSSSFQTRSQ